MGRNGRVERMDQIDQAMRLQTRKRDARQIERIDPEFFFQACTARVFRHEMAVERRIVRDERGVSHELYELLARLNGRRSVSDVSIEDIRQMRDFIGNGLARIHKRHEPFGDFTALKTSGSNLRELIFPFGNARGFSVDNHDIAVEVTIIGVQSLRF